jgi:predicted O-methyltransferase YrrM
MNVSATVSESDTEFDSGFIQLLTELNQCVARVGEPVAGNYLYSHNDPAFPHAVIDPKMQGKRQNLIHAVQNKKHMLEIGVNAGHSALIALYHSEVSYYGIDVGLHGYTVAAIEFLHRKFPGRVRYLPKGSLQALPYIAVQEPQLKFDLIHIDGNHELPFVETDFYNALRVAAEAGWILFDDTGNRYPEIQAFIGRMLTQELIEEVAAPVMDMHKAGNKLVKIRRN